MYVSDESKTLDITEQGKYMYDRLTSDVTDRNYALGMLIARICACAAGYARCYLVREGSYISMFDNEKHKVLCMRLKVVPLTHEDAGFF